MGILGALEKIFDITFKADIDISNVNLIHVENGTKFQKDGRSLHINIDELEPAERRDLLDLPREQFEAENRVLRHEEEQDVLAIEQGFTEDNDEVLKYFEGLLSERWLGIIEDSLYLRALLKEKDLTKEEILERKRDIARGREPNAFYISNLATAGYFHPNGGVRDILVTMRLNEEYDLYRFQKQMDAIVDDKLLCVFVENDDEVNEVTQETISRLATYQEKDPINEWLDIRGIGPECEKVIDGVVQNLEEEFIGIDYDRWKDEEENLIVRIHPHSIRTLS